MKIEIGYNDKVNCRYCNNKAQYVRITKTFFREEIENLCKSHRELIVSCEAINSVRFNDLFKPIIKPPKN